MLIFERPLLRVHIAEWKSTNLGVLYAKSLTHWKLPNPCDSMWCLHQPPRGCLYWVGLFWNHKQRKMRNTEPMFSFLKLPYPCDSVCCLHQPPRRCLCWVGLFSRCCLWAPLPRCYWSVCVGASCRTTSAAAAIRNCSRCGARVGAVIFEEYTSVLYFSLCDVHLLDITSHYSENRITIGLFECQQFVSPRYMGNGLL